MKDGGRKRQIYSLAKLNQPRVVRSNSKGNLMISIRHGLLELTKC